MAALITATNLIPASHVSANPRSHLLSVLIPNPHSRRKTLVPTCRCRSSSAHAATSARARPSWRHVTSTTDRSATPPSSQPPSPPPGPVRAPMASPVRPQHWSSRWAHPPPRPHPSTSRLNASGLHPNPREVPLSRPAPACPDRPCDWNLPLHLKRGGGVAPLLIQPQPEHEHVPWPLRARKPLATTGGGAWPVREVVMSRRGEDRVLQAPRRRPRAADAACQPAIIIALTRVLAPQALEPRALRQQGTAHRPASAA
jgi:hypothetical protein